MTGAPAPLPQSYRVVIDPAARRLDAGRVLLGGSPLRLFRLAPAGARVLDRLLDGASVGEAGAGAGPLARRLCEAGALHPRPPSTDVDPGQVTVVVPVRDRADRLTRCLDALGTAGAAVVVVDDGSVDGSGDVAERWGARVFRRPGAGGPAAARNTGLQAAPTPFVAFVDSDCLPEPGWLAPLVAHLADPAVAAVAARVGGRRLDGGPVLARYESVRTPLDLGPLEGPVRPRSRVSYVPATALLVRRDAVLAVGGFDEALRFGEDVDLVWRLVSAGRTVRYAPASRVTHDHRTRLVPLLARRFGYGTAAAPLARRHPGDLVPLQVSGWSFAAWALVAAGHPLAALALAGATTALLPRKLAVLEHPWRQSLRLAGSGHLGAGRMVAEAVTRAWLPLAAVAAVRWRRPRAVLAACVALPALIDRRARRPALGPLSYVALRLADDAAYCAGVWWGCLRHRTLAPLRPDLSSWPGRRPRGGAGTRQRPILPAQSL